MDHKTRVWSAVHFKPVDRVPFDLFDEAGYLFSEGRYDPARRLNLSMEEQVVARIRFHQEFDTDLIFDAPVLGEGQVPLTVRLAPDYAGRYELLSATFVMVAGLWHPWPPHIRAKPGVDSGRDDRIELVVEWENGLLCQLSVELASGTAAGYEILMRSPEEWPLWREAYTPRLDGFDYRYVEQIRQAAPDVALYGTIVGPYGASSMLFGVERSSLLFYDEPKFAGQVLDWLTDVAIEVGRDLIRHGVEFLRVGEAPSSLLGPRLYREHVLPRHKRLAAALRQAGGCPIVHNCGHANAMLEAFAEAGFCGIEPLTPAPLGNVDLADAKKRVGDRVCLKGNLDPVHVVGKLSAAGVAAETRRCLEIGSPGSGYILSVADCMIPGTPLENLHAIVEVAHSYRPSHRWGCSQMLVESRTCSGLSSTS
jgi:hypothetical protein